MPTRPIGRWLKTTWRESESCIRSGDQCSSGTAVAAWTSRGYTTDNGADATQWEYWGGQNQIFSIDWVEASHYRLIAQHSGKVIDVDRISPANGAQVHQWDWWGGD